MNKRLLVTGAGHNSYTNDITVINLTAYPQVRRHLYSLALFLVLESEIYTLDFINRIIFVATRQVWQLS